MCCNPNTYDDSNPLLGVVLSGGKANCIVENDGLLLKEDQYRTKIIFDKLECLGIPVVISINPSQEEEYKKVFFPDRIVINKININGPLKGIFSIHDQFPDHDLIIVTSDFPDLSTLLIKNLVDIFDEKAGEHDFIVYSIQNKLEPLLGVYTAEGLNKAFSLYVSNQLEKLSMKHILEVGNTFSVELGPGDWQELKNYNSKEDLF